jgi:hypothetical protein
MGLQILQTVLIFAFSIWIAKKSIGSQHPKWGLYGSLVSIPVSIIVSLILIFFDFEISDYDDYSLDAYISDVVLYTVQFIATIAVIYFIATIYKRKQTSAPAKTKPQKKLGAFFILMYVLWIIALFGIFIHDINMGLKGLNEEIYMIIDRSIGIMSWMIGMGYLVFLQKRMKVKSVEELLETDNRSPVLFLRSFESEDKRTNYRVFKFKGMFLSNFRNMVGYTFDEFLLEETTKRIGPFIALGKPGDYLPMTGAARSYVHDENWQVVIREYCQKASLIIFLESITEGAKWELLHIRENINPEKLVVVTFPKHFKRDRLLWGNFYQVLNHVNIHVPQEDPGCGAVIRFKKDWKATVVKTGLKKPKEFIDCMINF